MSTKKKLLQAAAGSAGGAEPGLNVEQVFSTYLYDGNGSEQTINNGIELGDAKGFGGFSFSQSSDYFKISSLIQLIADFTLEAYIYSDSTFTNQNQILGSDLSIDANRQVYIDNSTKYLRMYDGSVLTSTSAVPQDQWCHIAITRSGSTITFYIDGVSSGTATSNATFEIRIIGGLVTGAGVNEDFKGKISNLRIVTGSVLYTSDFTPPSTNLTNVSGTQLLTAQGTSPQTDNSSNSYTISGFNTPSTYTTANTSGGGEGGLVWIKNRTGENHGLVDTEVNGLLFSNLTNAANTGITHTFNSNGFTVGSSGAMNDSPDAHASWTFRKAPKFFDVVTYTGTGSAQNISHNLGSVPAVVIVKRTSSAEDWLVYHRSTGNQAGTGLNETAATYTGVSAYWNSTTPTDSVFTVGTHARVNTSGETYVAYLFAHNDGDGDFGPTGDQDIIKCGSFTTDGSGVATVDLGFEPQWILYKPTVTGSWVLLDIMRGLTTGGNDEYLLANSSNAAAGTTNFFEVNSTGFKATALGTNQESIYIAIRRGPMAVPESATDVFAMDVGDGTSSPNFISNFPVDASLLGAKSGADKWYLASRLTGTEYLRPNLTNAAGSAPRYGDFDMMDAWWDGALPSDYQAWMWKRAPNYFDVVAFELGNSSNREVKHNLNATPEMIWWKKRSGSSNWAVFHKDLGQSKYLLLQDTAAEATISNIWGTSSFSSSAFYLDETQFGVSGDDCIAYLFASVDGVSKVGSYTGDGTTGRVIDCGFSSGARFVMVRTYTQADNWWIFDTKRGIVAGNDPRLYLNTTDAEATTADLVDPHSSGFIVNNVNGEMNFSGRGYIFYAIA